MVASNQAFEVENIHSILEDVVKKLADLPAEQKGEIEKDLQRLQSRIEHLLEEQARCGQAIADLTVSHQALTVREKTYRAITESIQDGLISIDQDWQITYINTQAARNGGCEPAELSGRKFWEAFPRLLGTELEANLRRVMAEKTPAQFEMAGVYQELWYHVNVYPATNGITVLWQDINARKQSGIATQNRQQQLEQLADLLDNAQEPIFVLDNHWNYIFANRSHHKNLNVEPGVLAGKNFWEFNPRAFGTPVEYHLRKAKEEGQPSHGRLRGLYVPRWFDFSVYPTPEGVSVFSYDRTEEVEAEQALQLALAQMRFYADSSLIGVVIGDEAGGLIEVNDYYLNLLGYTREEFNAGAIDWRKITPPEHLSADEKAILELREHGICSPYEKEYYRKDGTRVWVYLRDALLPDGKLGAIVLDITERKRAEKELQQSEENLPGPFAPARPD